MANIREIERIERIKFLIEVFKKNDTVNETKLTYEVMFKFGVSKRTAREYIEVAKTQCK